MKNCQLENFDIIFKNSNVLKSKEVILRFEYCHFINCKTLFSLDNINSPFVQIIMNRCSISNSKRIFYGLGNNYQLLVQKTSFIDNDLCFDLNGNNNSKSIIN